MTRILHFIPDDKFVDMIIDELDAFEGVTNRYCMYNRRSADEVKWHRHVDCVEFTPYGSKALEKTLAECRAGEYDGVVFHSMPNEFPYFAKNCGDVKKVFVPWGHDIYGMMRFKDYLPETERFMRMQASRSIKKKIGRHIRKIKHWGATIPLFPLNRKVRTIIEEIDYIAPVLSEDVELFRKAYPRSRIPEVIAFQYGYYKVEPNVGADCAAGPILVNNSATATGNHVDVFRTFDRIGVRSNLIVPLNYGDSPAYLDFVKDEGAKILGDRFKPILDFMPKDDYFKYISQCTHMVMGHNRQQALGNIIWGLSAGLKLFFWKRSPVYRQYKAMGFEIFSLEDATAEDFNTCLPPESQRRNAALVIEHFGREAMLRKLAGLVEIISRKRRS